MTGDETKAAGDGAKLLIVDGHAYAYRAFYAIRKLTGPDGAPTNAIFGFVKMLERMQSWLRPTHWVVVWDGGLAEARLEALPGYKANRPPMPPDLERQLDGITAWLAAARIPSLVRDGVEADDWIGTLARRVSDGGAQVVIASSDKDFMQLVSERVGLLNPNDKAESIWTAAQVRAKSGVEPEQIVDWLSLTGDAVDNIPGVPGVGPKTAADLLRRFGSLEGLFARLEAVASDRLRTALAGAKEAVLRNRNLIRLSEIEGDCQIGQFALQDGERARLRELYARWGFRGLHRELDEEMTGQALLF